VGKICTSSFHASDGVTLEVTTFEPNSAPARATLVHAHGLSEYGTLFSAQWEFLADRGVKVLTYDQRGHGRSGGTRGCIHCFDKFEDDFVQVISQYSGFIGPRYSIFAHSMGAVLATGLVLKERIHPVGVALSAPALRPAPGMPLSRKIVGRLLGIVTPCVKLPKYDEGIDLTTDEQAVAAYRRDPLVNHFLCPSSYAAIFDNGAWVLKHAERLSTPLLLVSSRRDAISDHAAIESFYERVPGRKMWHREDEGLHQLLLDRQAPSVLNSLLKWTETL
jgi:alpha-beta hydrolase superfamily lysophospholipase